METITKFMSLLAISYLILVHNNIIAADDQLRGKELINKICDQTQTKDLCVNVLSSDPSSSNASLVDLAMIALKVASTNASEILTDTKIMIDDSTLNPGIQQGLADCKETLLDAEGQLEDTIAALLVDAKSDAVFWLQAALAAIDTCDASIPGDDDILSKKSVGFRQLCNIAVTISKAMNNSP